MGNYGKHVDSNLELLDCTIGRGAWRNFTGDKGQYNDEGEYGFTVFLPESLYEDMLEEGWYVKHKAQYAGDEREFQIDVSFSYDNYPPAITMVTHDGTSVVMTKENISLLQTADFERCDLVIRPYNWTNARGESGVKAYVDTMTVWVRKPRRTMNASFGREEEEEV